MKLKQFSDLSFQNIEITSLRFLKNTTVETPHTPFFTCLADLS